MSDPNDALLISDLQRDEGCRLTAYPDPKSHGAPWTIGYGHTGREVHPGLVWTQLQANGALQTDINGVRLGLNTALPWSERLDDVRKDVLANVAFNLGVHGLLEFQDTLAHLRVGAYTASAADLLDSDAARELPERYGRLAVMLRTGARAA